jgi:hypothetical protein
LLIFGCSGSMSVMYPFRIILHWLNADWTVFELCELINLQNFICKVMQRSYIVCTSSRTNKYYIIWLPNFHFHWFTWFLVEKINSYLILKIHLYIYYLWLIIAVNYEFSVIIEQYLKSWCSVDKSQLNL